jgi:cytochrome c-type biogenesis protein CcmE
MTERHSDREDRDGSLAPDPEDFDLDSEPDPGDSSPEPERLESSGGDDGLNWRFVVGLLIAISGIAYLVVDGLGSETYFFTVDEAVAKSQSMTGHRIRVKGQVVEGSIEGKEGSIGRNFTISAKGETLRVRYRKAMPDTFKPEAKVVATGTLEKPGVLAAEKVLVKCPSRYEGQPPTAHKKGQSGSNYQ